MKKLFIFISISFLILQLQAQKKEITTFILVRHAEKAVDGTKNPDLTKEGYLRAEKLKSLFQNAEIGAIYSTEYKRTQQTVQPLADHLNLKIQSYDPRDKEFLKSISKPQKGKTVVISGHSNTIPFLVNELIGEERFEQLDDSEYDKIFIVSLRKLGKGSVTVMTF